MKIASGPAQCRIASLAFCGIRDSVTRVKFRLRPARHILGGAALAASVLVCSPTSADTLALSCGAPIKSVVKSHYNEEFSTTSATFVNVPQAAVIINVPTGQTQCVKVRFSTVLTCEVLTSNQHCYVKVYDSAGYLWSPSSAVYSSDPKLAAHSFEWVARLGAGSHTLRMRAAADGTKLTMTNWTLNVEVAK